MRAPVAALLCLCVLFAAGCGTPDGLDRATRDPACPPGLGRGILDPGFLGPDDERGSTAVRKLLRNPDFGASDEAAEDLRGGEVDPRLVETLRTVTEQHRICVDVFKEGHFFIEGVEDGPRIPEGYGEAGGLPNTHYFGRAADIRYVDGEPVEGNGAGRAVLGVGRVLAGLPPARRPDQIIGPEEWTRTLGSGYEEGWVLEEDQLDLHDEHLHLGYTREDGTRNIR
ncbi:MAG: hypothetical protein AVDCRST_MAG02-1391 [uncultured Rubrobacteraceae bacterium]|uniref:Uncharacterized protein n=1 Tax=uncultured Rubrobacteraceae bacterium TaxID=349277 RepID=A0A6J4QVC2_9ACTN|nr:MAG: hypothetical protein AVDCRST_MAG02-1391 [uncultured Rubrobacteraceae bacterium]